MQRYDGGNGVVVYDDDYDVDNDGGVGDDKASSPLFPIA